MDSPPEAQALAPDAAVRAARGVVQSAERLWDALALLMIVSGTTLFLLARNGLGEIAAGTHKLPPGVASFVQRADYFSTQSDLGLGMVGVGVAVGLGSSLRHAMRRLTGRAQSERPEPSAISHQPSASVRSAHYVASKQ